MNNSSNDSIPVKILNFIVGSVVAFVMGLWMMVGLAISAIFPSLKLDTNLRILNQANPDSIDTVTAERTTYVAAIGLLAIWASLTAPSFLTRVEVAVPLVVAAIAGLGLVLIRGLELSGSGSTQYSTAHKLIGNVSAGVLTAVAAAVIAPTLSPRVLAASVLTGMFIALFSTWKIMPKSIALILALGFGMGAAFHTGGLLGALVVLLGAAIQIDTISSALETLAQSPSESNKTRATNNYTLGFTLLQTTVIAVVLSGISLLLR